MSQVKGFPGAQVPGAHITTVPVTVQTVHVQGQPAIGGAGGAGGMAGQWGQAGGGGGGSTLGAWIGTLGGSTTIQFPGLSTDELRELEALETEYRELAKASQLSEFKKLPASMRQNILDVLEWDARIDAMDMEANQGIVSQRLQELRSRNFNPTSSQMQWFQGHGSTHGHNYPNYGRIRLPAHLTLPDIRQAHAERSLEEEILGVQE